ncbi:hypothetical protein [Pseudofrankia saprophytica]|uniref:hypothetical protein n=1 Tax=Pseudofrankia saprophytica TaxID=298655 RepID=UPI0002E2CBED|nr:hypothetical protein [Pseudofrankia saprophytica]OHV42049.1 hypothetical protein BCD49_00360 [Pseudofrankia sp. EUN1h]
MASPFPEAASAGHGAADAEVISTEAGPTPTPTAAVLAITFTGVLVLAAVFVWVSAARHVGLAMLCCFVALVAWRATISGAALAGVLAWPFYLGMVVRGDGQLAAPGRSGLIALALLAGAAVTPTMTRRVVTRHVRRRVRPASAADGLATLHPTRHRSIELPRSSATFSDNGCFSAAVPAAHRKWPGTHGQARS